ncbi:MAG TPA: GTPase ObgE [Candidatus Hydrogenedentes bacterium]|nr:GTPase ObgE [Candidatus Hydrogenedentota bacterium]
MFVDQARIKVTGGAGGNGCCSFRKEKYVPRGGPDGGDGGDGGSVHFVASSRLTSLEPLRYHAHVKAARGAHGKGSGCHGKTGADKQVLVPCGTLVRAAASNALLADLVHEGDRFLAARGGQGGKGNARFATSTNRAPRFAEKGEPGDEAEYLLELKLIAEVGIVGLPNAGKSTLLARVSAAKPKIADYPFTTLAPNLGMVSLDDYRTLALADIPGIIEGAAQGKGLGHDFLRHIERTKVLLFLIDLGDPDPAASYATLRAELARHSPLFEHRPSVIAFNKMDLSENRVRFDALAPAFPNAFSISAVAGEGVPSLLEHLWTLVDRARKIEDDTPIVETAERDYIYEAPFRIHAVDDGFEVIGRSVLRAVVMTDFDNEQAVNHMHHLLREMGVFHALKRSGAQAGATIHIGDFELEYHPD